VWGFKKTQQLNTKIYEKYVILHSQAFFAGIQGGDPAVGFASGALSSAASSLWVGVGPDNGGWHGIGGCAGSSDIGMVSFGVIMGGAGASLTGGNFWQGAATGLVVSGLNHLAHRISAKTTLTEQDIKKIKDVYPSGDPNDPNFVHKDKIYEMIGGDIYKDYLLNGYDSNGNPNSAYSNTCALRLSIALNKAGFVIPKTNGAYSGGKKLNYFYKVNKMEVYLSKNYNFSQASAGTKIPSSIIIQKNCGWNDATGHVDVIYKGRAGSQFYKECSTTFYSSK